MAFHMPITIFSRPVWHRAISASKYTAASTTNSITLWPFRVYIEFASCRLLVTNKPHFVVIWMWQMWNSFVSTKPPLGTRQACTIAVLFAVQAQRNQHGTAVWETVILSTRPLRWRGNIIHNNVITVFMCISLVDFGDLKSSHVLTTVRRQRIKDYF